MCVYVCVRLYKTGEYTQIDFRCKHSNIHKVMTNSRKKPLCFFRVIKKKKEKQEEKEENIM